MEYSPVPFEEDDEVELQLPNGEEGEEYLKELFSRCREKAKKRSAFLLECVDMSDNETTKQQWLMDLMLDSIEFAAQLKDQIEVRKRMCATVE